MASGKCYHHPSKDAVAQCSECGKGICKDCYDSYGAGMGAGKALCFDCTEEMVKDHAADIAAFRRQVKTEIILMIIGAVIGYILGVWAFIGDNGSMAFVSALLIACLGASLGALIKVGKFIKRIIPGDAGDVIAYLAACFLAPAYPFITLFGFIKRNKQIKQADEVIASDENILRNMRDYFAYTQTMENNVGVDLTKLADQGGVLFENTYAQTVINKGEKEAQAELRQGMVTIAANGEIVRSFDVKPKNKAA